MESLATHPSTAQQAKAFTSETSLSYPGGTGNLTPPSEKDGNNQANGQKPTEGAGVASTTPAATPGAAQGTGASGIVPTLQ